MSRLHYMIIIHRDSCQRQIWVSEPHFWEVRGDTRPWLMARWKARGRLSICLNWTFSLSVVVPELWGKMCTAWLLSQGGRPCCTQILPGHGRPPSTILGVRKLETLGYPMVKTASLCIPSFWHNTGVWQTDERTDGRICCSIYSTCKAMLCVHSFA